MKSKSFLSLFIAVVLCLSPFTAFAEEIVMEYSPFDEYVDENNMLSLIIEDDAMYLSSK